MSNHLNPKTSKKNDKNPTSLNETPHEKGFLKTNTNLSAYVSFRHS